MLTPADKYEEAVEGRAKQLPEDRYLRSLSAVWLGESCQSLDEDVNSGRWLEIGCDRAKELMDFNPITAYSWQSRAFEALGDVMGAMQVYQTALSQERLRKL